LAGTARERNRMDFALRKRQTDAADRNWGRAARLYHEGQDLPPNATDDLAAAYQTIAEVFAAAATGAGYRGGSQRGRALYRSLLVTAKAWARSEQKKRNARVQVVKRAHAKEHTKQEAIEAARSNAFKLAPPSAPAKPAVALKNAAPAVTTTSAPPVARAIPTVAHSADGTKLSPRPHPKATLDKNSPGYIAFAADDVKWFETMQGPRPQIEHYAEVCWIVPTMVRLPDTSSPKWPEYGAYVRQCGLSGATQIKTAEEFGVPMIEVPEEEAS
jgi:hypothetical protein